VEVDAEFSIPKPVGGLIFLQGGDRAFKGGGVRFCGEDIAYGAQKKEECDHCFHKIGSCCLDKRRDVIDRHNSHFFIEN
jgi:hypothetical protein